jgi:hypothetical protein
MRERRNRAESAAMRRNRSMVREPAPHDTDGRSETVRASDVLGNFRSFAASIDKQNDDMARTLWRTFEC